MAPSRWRHSIATVRRADHPGRPGARVAWERVKAIFLEAIDRPEEERRAFLAEACAGDEVLKAAVESLLAADHRAGSFAGTPAAALLGAWEPADLERNRLEVGSRLGAYEVTGFVGAGGMGEVYRARDTCLGRLVAVKTVGATASDAASKARLLREARHASVLRHPNICTVHEVGEERGRPFIVMEYVEGRSLRDLRQEGPLEPRRVVAYGVQVADALAYAHEHGVVHRDLKSSNVLVDGADRAIVVDFGLARRLPRPGGAGGSESTVTLRHGIAGTLEYMAPEVLLGERADARSDIWSLGVLLYELLSGTLRSDGRTSFETSSAIIGEAPRPLPRRVPLALRLVVDRCLAKTPTHRYARAAEVRDALAAIAHRRAWAVGGRLLMRSRRRRHRWRRWASPSQLGTLGVFRVVSRSSSARMAASGKPIDEIGAALGANAVVQGALGRAGDQLRAGVPS